MNDETRRPGEWYVVVEVVRARRRDGTIRVHSVHNTKEEAQGAADPERGRVAFPRPFRVEPRVRDTYKCPWGLSAELDRLMNRRMITNPNNPGNGNNP